MSYFKITIDIPAMKFKQTKRIKGKTPFKALDSFSEKIVKTLSILNPSSFCNDDDLFNTLTNIQMVYSISITIVK